MDRGAAAGASALAAVRRVPHSQRRSIAPAAFLGVAAAVATACRATAQVTAPADANCTLGDFGLDCSWTQPASSAITQYRRT